MARVDPRAVVHDGAELGADVEVGPYAIVGPRVVLADGVRLHGHAVVDGRTELGPQVEVFPFAVVGARPQDKKYDFSETRLVVGARTVIREYVSLHPGSRGGGLTSLGSDGLIMAYCHVAHDCRLGDRVTLANGVQIAGHCIIEDDAVLGGTTTVHQFVRVGRHSMTGAATHLVRDVPPYTLVDGHPARLIGLNRVGLRRHGFDEGVRVGLHRAFRWLFGSPRLQEGLRRIEAEGPSSPEVQHLCDFAASSHRGLTRPRRRVKPPSPRAPPGPGPRP